MTVGYNHTHADGKIVLTRESYRIHPTPIPIQYEWRFEDQVVSNQVTLTTEGAITFDVDVWRIDAANRRGRIETQELSLHVGNRFLHNFGAARNFTLIDDIEVNRLEGQIIEFTFTGTDMHLEEYMKTEQMEINTQSRMLLRNQFNGICEPSYRFSESVCERTFELDIPWGESDCGRFDERLGISIQPQHNGSFEVAISVDRTLSNPTTGIQLIENDIVINKATGDDVVIQLRSEFSDIDDLSDYVYGIQADLRPHLAINMFEFEQSETLSIELDDNPKGILRRFKLSSNHDSVNGCECTRFRILIEEGKYSVKRIEKISIEHDTEHYFTVKLQNTILFDPYKEKDMIQRSKVFKNLEPDYYVSNIDHLVPFYHQRDSKIEFYRSLVAKEFHYLPIDIRDQINDTFGVSLKEKIYHLCPFSLKIYSSKDDNSEIGLLQDWMTRRNEIRADLTTLSRLKIYDRMSDEWKVELRRVVFGKGDDLIDRLHSIIEDVTITIDEDCIHYFMDLLNDLKEGNAITENQFHELYRKISEDDIGAWYDVEEFHDDGGGF